MNAAEFIKELEGYLNRLKSNEITIESFQFLSKKNRKYTLKIDKENEFSIEINKDNIILFINEGNIITRNYTGENPFFQSDNNINKIIEKGNINRTIGTGHIPQEFVVKRLSEKGINENTFISFTDDDINDRLPEIIQSLYNWANIIKEIKGEYNNNSEDEAIKNKEINPTNFTCNFWRIGTSNGLTKLWDKFKIDNYIAIGWGDIGDLSIKKDYNKTEISELLDKTVYPFADKKTKSRKTGEILDFYSSIKNGDIILAQDGDDILGIGEIVGDYEFEKNDEFAHRRPVRWIINEIDGFLLKDGRNTTVYKITKQESINRINEFISNSKLNNYNKIALNIILYGPPGTGKTYSTFDIAANIVTKDYFDLNNIGNHQDNIQIFNNHLHERIHFLTFHQNYSYEEFVGGIRPELGGSNLSFEWKAGVFLKACANAYYIAKYPESIGENGEIIFNEDNFINKELKEFGFENKISIEEWFLNECQNINYNEANQINWNQKVVLIIDEINRANISRVFGELITLIEDDKRIGGKHQLILSLPNGRKFGVPANLVIIGTMNTADKSIALLDIALRRRFEFKPLYPQNIGNNIKNWDFLDKLNKAIMFEKGSADYCIGHSYFMNEDPLTKIMNNKVLPLLNEYFMSDEDTILKVLNSAIKNANNFNKSNNNCFNKDEWNRILWINNETIINKIKEEINDSGSSI
jgi:5-methylcytosine-specific restriction protein B